MSFFLIVKQSDSEKQLHILSFDCDIAEKNTAILVFTSMHSAEDYIAMAGWTTKHFVEQVEATELLKRLIIAKEHGVTHVAIEPEREKQLKGELPVMQVLDDVYCVHADLLKRLQQEVAPASKD